MNRKEAQELATILYEQRERILASYGPETADTLLHALDGLVLDLRVKFVSRHLHSVTPRAWRDACFQGKALFVTKRSEL